MEPGQEGRPQSVRTAEHRPSVPCLRRPQASLGGPRRQALRSAQSLLGSLSGALGRPRRRGLCRRRSRGSPCSSSTTGAACRPTRAPRSGRADTAHAPHGPCRAPRRRNQAQLEHDQEPLDRAVRDEQVPPSRPCPTSCRAPGPRPSVAGAPRKTPDMSDPYTQNRRNLPRETGNLRGRHAPDDLRGAGSRGTGTTPVSRAGTCACPTSSSIVRPLSFACWARSTAITRR
jgi:hypothetical protein